ncbi:Ras-related protein RABA2a, partial [Cucurbita argyrosperma subsp. argyrosperma]
MARRPDDDYDLPLQSCLSGGFRRWNNPTFSSRSLGMSFCLESKSTLAFEIRHSYSSDSDLVWARDFILTFNGDTSADHDLVVNYAGRTVKAQIWDTVPVKSGCPRALLVYDVNETDDIRPMSKHRSETPPSSGNRKTHQSYAEKEVAVIQLKLLLFEATNVRKAFPNILSEIYRIIVRSPSIRMSLLLHNIKEGKKPLVVGESEGQFEEAVAPLLIQKNISHNFL